MNQLIRKILFVCLLICCCLIINFGYAQTAWANIRQQQEKPGQILYQSRHSLRDNQGSTWQIIVFKRVKEGLVKDLDLRLVGFPNQINFIHPQDLIFTTTTGKQFTAPDQFAQQAPAPNVGQYKVKDILVNLVEEKSLEVNLPVQENRSLTIPYPVLLEWQEIIDHSTVDS